MTNPHYMSPTRASTAKERHARRSGGRASNTVARRPSHRSLDDLEREKAELQQHMAALQAENELLSRRAERADRADDVDVRPGQMPRSNINKIL